VWYLQSKLIIDAPATAPGRCRSPTNPPRQPPVTPPNPGGQFWGIAAVHLPNGSGPRHVQALHEHVDPVRIRN
jgi:hypothetical protein